MITRWYQSIAVKLFALMISCVVATVAAVTWQQSSVLYDYLQRSLEDSTIQQSRQLATDLSALLKQWSAITNLAVSRMSGSTPTAYGEFIGSFVYAEPDLEVFHLITGSPARSVIYRHKNGGTIATFEAKTAGKKNNVELTVLKWINRLNKKKTTHEVEIFDLGPTTGLPLVAMARRFAVSGEKSAIWAVLAVKVTNLTKVIPTDKAIQAWIVNDKSNPVLDTGQTEHPAKLMPSVLQAIQSSPSGFGFKAYRDPSGDDMLAAYALLSEYGLQVIVSQNAKGPRLAILRTIVHTLIWAWLFVMGAVAASYIMARQITQNLRAVTGVTKTIADGNFQIDLAIKGHDEVAVLSSSVNMMAKKIRDLLNNMVEAARREKELETARLVQSTLFPHEVYTSDHVCIAGTSFPASECGGDWWGYFPVGSDRVYIFIADATGHGAAAAMVSAIAFAQCHLLGQLMRSAMLSGLTPAQILEKINHVFCNAGVGVSTMTMFVACIDLSEGIVTFANAGHNRPFIIPADQNDRRLGPATANSEAGGQSRKFNHSILKSAGIPLGMEPGATYKEDRMQIVAGDKFFLFTDGLFECKDKNLKQWGDRSLRRSINKFGTNTPSDLQKSVIEEAFVHFGDHPRDDDITVVVLEVASNWSCPILARSA